MKAKKLPNRLYSHWENEGTQDEFLQTDEDPSGAVKRGETKTVGVYELVGYAEIKNTTDVTVKPLKRK